MTNKYKALREELARHKEKLPDIPNSTTEALGELAAEHIDDLLAALDEAEKAQVLRQLNEAQARTIESFQANEDGEAKRIAELEAALKRSDDNWRGAVVDASRWFDELTALKAQVAEQQQSHKNVVFNLNADAEVVEAALQKAETLLRRLPLGNKSWLHSELIRDIKSYFAEREKEKS